METPAAEIIKILPSTLWASFAIAILVLFYRSVRDDILPKLTNFKAMGVEFAFVKDSMNAAIELAQKSPQWKVDVSPEDKRIVLCRAKRHTDIFNDVQILWVDDHPENNLNERRMFRQLKAEIDIAKSTEEALDILRRGKYDLVISDMARGDKAIAGLEFLHQLREGNETTPLIFYVGVFDLKKGVPGQAFGITNRPDELLHLSLDAIERRKQGP